MLGKKILKGAKHPNPLAHRQSTFFDPFAQYTKKKLEGTGVWRKHCSSIYILKLRNLAKRLLAQIVLFREFSSTTLQAVDY